MQPSSGALKTAVASYSSSQGTACLPLAVHPPGFDANSFLCDAAESDGKLQRMDETHRPSVPLLCFVDFFPTVKH